MLRLDALQLFNWGYAPFQVPLPIGDITLLQGRNGSGKTTYLNALTILLGARHLPKRQPFEKFVYPGEHWAFVRAIADNAPDEAGRRPFDAVFGGVIDDRVTLACVLERKSGWRRQYFIVPGDYVPDPNASPDNQFCFTQTEYRRMLSHVGVRDALLNLLELGLYGMRDIARDPRSRFQFFLRLVGNEEIQERYQQARREWWEQREQTMRLDDRLTQEKELLGQMETSVRVMRRRRELEAQHENDQLLAQHAQVRDLRRSAEMLEEQRLETAEELETVERRLAGLDEEQERFAERFAAWQARYDDWRRERDAAEQQANDARDAFVRTQEEHTQQQRTVDELRALPDIPVTEAEAAYEAADETSRRAWAALQEHQQRKETLEAEREQLLADKIPLPPYVDSFQATLHDAGIAHVLVADVVEIIAPRWQEAVEGLLGGERFTVVVEGDGAQIRAKELGQEAGYRHYVSPPNENIDEGLHPDSLWHVVEVADARVRGWVQRRIGEVRRVATIAEGHRLAGDGIASITAQAYLQNWRGGRSVHPSILVCGRAARETRLQQVEAALQDLGPRLAAAWERSEVATAEREEAQQRLHDARRRAGLPAALDRLAALEQSLATRRERFEHRRAAYRAVKAREETWNDERSEFDAERARLGERTRRLEAEHETIQRSLQGIEGDIAETQDQIQRLEPALPELSETLRQTFAREDLSAEEYRTRARHARDDIEGLPEVEFEDISEELYANQRSNVQHLEEEVAAMREREREHRRLFEDALEDFRRHIDHLFNQGMNREFRRFCTLVGALGEVRAWGDNDQWQMDVRVGFHGKDRQRWEVAPLSQGQEVMTGLLLVLSALQAVGATPILLLDELMSTLDEVNAPLVLRQLRRTGAQCFVASPHVRPQADAIADVVWALQPRRDEQEYAPPVGVLVKGGGEVANVDGDLRRAE